MICRCPLCTGKYACAALLALTLTACKSQPTELGPHERAAGAAALTAWRESGLPEPDHQCDVTRFQVRELDAEDYWHICRGDPQRAAGCLSWDSSNAWFRPTRYPVVAVSPIHHSEPHIIVHELLHAMAHCAELPTAYTALNREHLDPRIWEAAGGESSVQARAMKLVPR